MRWTVDAVNGDDGWDGTAERPFASLGMANRAVGAGDVVVVRPGVYREAVVMKTEGVAWIGEDGPEIDGGYSAALWGAAGYKTAKGAQIREDQLPAPTEGNAKRGGWAVPAGGISAKGYHSLVVARAKGVWVEGFVIRNSSGRAVVVDGDGVTVRNCRVDFTYGGAIGVATGRTGILLEGLEVTRSSMKAFDPTAEGAGPDSVQTTIIVGGKGVKVRRCVVWGCMGEGISADKGSEDVEIEDCECHTNNHWSGGFNFTKRLKMRRNVFYWCDNLASMMGKSGPADLFVGGSERASVEQPREARAEGFVIEDNLFVGGKRPWMIGGEGRPVQFVDSLIAHNTIIGRVTPGQVKPAFTWSVLSSARHVNTVVRDNIILVEPGSGGISYEAGGDVVWGHTLSNVELPAGMRGTGDVLAGSPVLVNPFVAVEGVLDLRIGEMPSGITSFDLENYRPLVDSPAVGTASDGGDIGALEWVGDGIPEEPEEPPVVDWGWVVEELEAQRSLLWAARDAAAAAVLGMDELIEKFGGMGE